MLAEVKVLIVLTMLSQGAVCLAAPDVMICLHRDGQVRVEPFEPTCCRGEAAPRCPDEECRDLPVLDPSPIDSPDAPLLLDTAVLLAPPLLEEFPTASVPTCPRPRSFSGPPPPEAGPYVTIVILRL